ncbi:E3 SUMO-protein ligase Nse2 (Mms21) [Trema orientale]|uniref:E3 SUMO-protein ligase Nse2 (Mms21) n=1 Tax=Trema orientale TaxID=63057 RepID=A0A2P5F4Q8_TREOI|nr:E3 SUMO-protein ligase Nse2 (Mms21) [Trema orientale]
MASSSAARPGSVTGRVQNAASTLYSDNQSLIVDIRKGFHLIKDIAVDLEKENESEKLRELDNAVIELLNALEDCKNLSSAIQSVAENYQPGPELTDFKKMFEDEISKVKANSSAHPENHPLRHQFKQAIWNVHHSGQPMPGEEHEDIVMTGTQCSLRNVSCPISGKPVTELANPVRSVECKHIYEKEAVMDYIRSKKTNARCPVAACPKILHPRKVVCDPLLLIEIEEMRTMTKQTDTTEVIEDFTDLDEEEA